MYAYTLFGELNVMYMYLLDLKPNKHQIYSPIIKNIEQKITLKKNNNDKYRIKNHIKKVIIILYI